jgi:hypothetical protein
MRLLAPHRDTVVQSDFGGRGSEVQDCMPEENEQTGAQIHYGAVSRALRTELAARGHHLAGDTTGMYRALYIMGANDVARAFFEFKPSAGDAIYELVHQGAWVASMPPRFVVLPRAEDQDGALETLEQMKAIPLLFDADGETIAFPDLDRLLQEHLDGA